MLNLCLALAAVGASQAGPPASGTQIPDIRSGAVLVIDDRGQRIYGKNTRAVKPIASITKLMTAMVVLDANLPMDEEIRILAADRDQIRSSGSRLQTERARLTRRELLLLALMSSENRAASALGRTTLRGGTPAFVAAMNRKAQALGLHDTRFADASGLDGRNVSTAEDLATLVQSAARYPLIRSASTRDEHLAFPHGPGAAPLQYRNTNPLVRNPDWQIELSKTGYLSEAGRCLVMRARIADRTLTLVFLDAAGKLTPVGDSNRLRKWLEAGLGRSPAG
jgi:D-alanyl-D-alanine endopeptidase (penicillin-binding protein 7)